MSRKLTRDSLRALRDGESRTFNCHNGRELQSWRNTAYDLQIVEGCTFKCHYEGLKLTVTRYDKV